MGVRETLNRHSKAIGIASAMMIAVCLAFAVKQYKHGGRPSFRHFADKADHTTDDARHSLQTLSISSPLLTIWAPKRSRCICSRVIRGNTGGSGISKNIRMQT